ncbi:MAG: glycosyltransferase family 4 protein [Terriglobales bacterium]
MRILYISYFGVQKHLVQTQVVPYLRELAAAGCQVVLLSFEESTGDRAAAQRERERLAKLLTEYGIAWHALRYHKRPSLPATIYDVVAGTVYAAGLMLRRRFDVVHARSHVPAVIALCLKSLFGVRMVFDLRGVMAEEYVDAGRWRQGGIAYRLTKWTETRALRSADGIVMLTHNIREALMERSPELRKRRGDIEIIPCCVMTDKYHPRLREPSRKRLGLEDKKVMAYVGSLGSWYMMEAMAQAFAEFRNMDPSAHFLIITQSEYELITTPLRALGVPESAYTVMTAPVEEVPGLLIAADFAISFIQPCFSKRSSSPTKIGEYLAAGLPILTNAGIGDVDEIVTGEQVGVLVDGFDPGSYQAALTAVATLLNDGTIQARCRETAERRFAMHGVGREGYLRVYRRLGLQPAGATASGAGS